MYISRDEKGKASRIGTVGVASLGAGIGAIREVGKLRDKINKQYAEACARADAEGKPRPPRPDTSTKTLLAILKGSVKGAVVGTGLTFIPGVGRALKDTAASLGAMGNKLTGGSVFGKPKQQQSFSFMNTLLLNRDFSENENYTLQYLSDKDFSEINLDNLDIGEVTERDLWKCFFSIANIAGQVYTKPELQQYFARKKIIQNNPLAQEDAKMLGLSKAAMPVLGAMAGGVYGAAKARKRALEQWEAECRLADAQGRPCPPKPSILTAAGGLAKGAVVGGGIGWVGSKIAPNINRELSEKVKNIGIMGKKTYNNATKQIKENTKAYDLWKTTLGNARKEYKSIQGAKPSWKEWLQANYHIPDFLNGNIPNLNEAFFSVTYNDYRAALARKGQTTSLTEQEFANLQPEDYDIILRNMQPMNFSFTDKLEKVADKMDNANALTYAGYGSLLGLGAGTVIAAIKRNKDYEQYKVEAEAKGEQPVSKVKYILASKEFYKNIGRGAGAGLEGGVVAYGINRLAQGK